MIVNMPADLLYFCLGQPTHVNFCERLDSPAHFDFCEGWLDSPTHFDFCEGLDDQTHLDSCDGNGGGPSDSVTPRSAPYGSLLAWLVAYNRTSESWLTVVEYNIAWISGNEDYCAGRAARALAGRDNWIQFNALHFGVNMDPLLILNKQDQLKSQARDRQG